jgi:DNA modification methylase
VSVHYADDWLTVYHGDAATELRSLDAESVHCVVTSPPYWGLRDYGTATWIGGDAACDHKRAVRSYRDGCVGCGIAMEDETDGCRWCADRHVKRRKHGTPEGRHYNDDPEDHWGRDRSRDQVTAATVPFKDTCGKCGAIHEDGQLGLEATPEAYVTALVEVFREIRRVLRSDGTVWLNLGDSYAGSTVGGGDGARSTLVGTHHSDRTPVSVSVRVTPDLKPKDLVGIPWMVAFALRADGWYLRSDVIWSKPNPMPESVTDRPTKSHEYLFLLSKSARYYFDADAVREAGIEPAGITAAYRGQKRSGAIGREGTGNEKPGASWTYSGTRNIRSVWTVATQPYPGAHFATFPPKLIEPCILAGCPEGGTVLDPFAGSGTTGLVAQRLSRRAVLIDLSMDYLGQLMGRNRDIPLGLGA